MQNLAHLAPFMHMETHLHTAELIIPASTCIHSYSDTKPNGYSSHKLQGRLLWYILDGLNGKKFRDLLYAVS